MRRVDVRVLAATNKNLQIAIEEDRFRHDLHFRLNVFTIVVPPLRERREDILDLAMMFLNEEAQSQLPIRLATDLRTWLERYDWPGNVRELRNVCKYLAAHAWGKPQIELTDLPQQLQPETKPEHASSNPFEQERIDLERSQLARAMRETKGNVPAAAKLLRIGRNRVYVKLRRYGLNPDSFRE